MTELITQSQFARNIGVTRQYINGLVRKGVISLVDGKVDPIQANEALVERRDPTLPSKAKLSKSLNEMSSSELIALRSSLAEESSSSSDDVNLSSKEKLLMERARIMELKRREREGQLIPLEDVEADAEDAAIKLKAAIMAIPDRAAPEIAGMTDLKEVHAYLVKEIREALAEMSSDFLADDGESA